MSTELVRSLWNSIQARDWIAVASHFSETAQLHWPVSGEVIAGRNGIVAVNQQYPEGWSIEVLAVDALVDGRVVSRVKVAHPPRVFFAVSFFTLREGLIVQVEEYWSTQEEPEAWRNEEIIPGWQRTDVPI